MRRDCYGLRCVRCIRLSQFDPSVCSSTICTQTLYGTLWSHFAPRPFRKSLGTLRTCEPSPTADSFEFSIFERFLAHFRDRTIKSCPFLWQPCSKLARSASRGRFSKFDPPFDAPGSELFSALRINEVRHN